MKLTREADKAGAKLPHRESADRKELSQYAEMERARSRSAFSVILPASMTRDITSRDRDADGPAEAGEDDEQENDDAPGDEGEEEDEDNGDTASA